MHADTSSFHNENSVKNADTYSFITKIQSQTPICSILKMKIQSRNVDPFSFISKMLTNADTFNFQNENFYKRQHVQFP
jgi:hypothetical protein